MYTILWIIGTFLAIFDGTNYGTFELILGIVLAIALAIPIAYMDYIFFRLFFPVEGDEDFYSIP